MALSLTSNQSGANSDYIKYVQGSPVKKDRAGNPALLDFTLVPWETAFVKLNRGAHINFSTTQYSNWFTGYITNDAQLTYLGKDGITKEPIFGYNYEATDDSYILGLKPIGLLPPFINRTAGEILLQLINILDTGNLFNTSNITNGPLLARYIVDPYARFQTIVQDLCNISAFRFRCNNYTVYFEEKDNTACTLTVDGNSQHFTPKNLVIRPTTDPIINDAIVLGSAEPQNAITEYFMGDGESAQFPLLAGMFGASSAVLIKDDFQGSTIDSSQWTIYDPGVAHMQLANGYLNIEGGNSNGSSNPLDVHLDSATVIPLEGVLRLTHGQWDFTSLNSPGGVIGGLWTGEPDNSNYSGCIYGLLVRDKLYTVVNGVAYTGGSDPSAVLDTTKRYILRTICSFTRATRQDTTYSYVNQTGTNGSYTGNSSADTATFSTVVSEIDPATGELTNQYTLTTTGVSLDQNTVDALYILAASSNLYASVTGVTISAPPQASLSVMKDADRIHLNTLLSTATTAPLDKLSPQILGVNDLDAFDGQSPIATINTNNSSQSGNNGLGTPLYNPDDATLVFFKDTVRQISYIPDPGDIVALSYYKSGLAAGRIVSEASIESEATAWGDNGFRTIVRADISPAPRTSSECEAAAAAIVQESSFQHFEGTYTQNSIVEFTGEPLAGTILKFQNLPASFPSYLQAEEVSNVQSTLNLTSPQDTLDHIVSFGKSTALDKVLGRFYQTDAQINKGVNVNQAEMPTATEVNAIGTRYLSDVTGLRLVSMSLGGGSDYYYNFDTGEDAPAGGGFEIRSSDASWGADDAKNLLMRTSSRTFSVKRVAHGQTVFCKKYDGTAGNLLPYSEDLSQSVWIKTNSTVSTNIGKIFDRFGRVIGYGSVSTIDFGSGAASITQDTPSPVSSSVGTFSISLTIPNGRQVYLRLLRSTDDSVLASTTVTGSTQTAGWSHSVTYSGGAGGSGFIRVAIESVDNNPLEFTATQASFNATTQETNYFKTVTGAYGAFSRFASCCRMNFPLRSAGPNSVVVDPSTSNALWPNLDITLPTNLSDIWGIVVLDNHTNQVVYQDTIADFFANGQIVTVSNVSGNTTVEYSVWTYNLLGEVSDGFIQVSGTVAPAGSNGLADGTPNDMLYMDSSGTTVLYEPRPYIVVALYPGTPGSNYIVGGATFDRTVTFAANWSGSQANVDVNPTGSTTFTVKKLSGGVTTTVGTIVFNTSGVATFSTTGGVAQTFAAGDRLTIYAPGTPDATIADPFFNLVGVRS